MVDLRASGNRVALGWYGMDHWVPNRPYYGQKGTALGTSLIVHRGNNSDCFMVYSSSGYDDH